MPERIFVVGHAAVTCLGRDMNSTWQALVEGRSGIRRHPALGGDKYLQDLGGMVEDFGPGSAAEDPAIAKLAARFLHLSMAAARGAWCDAGLDRLEGQFDPHRAAVVVGSAFGGLDLLEAEQDRMIKRRSLAVSPYLVPAMIINQAAGQIAQHLRLYGPSAAPANACASGGHAVVLGAMFLRAGDADWPFAAAGRARSRRRLFNGFATMKALSGTQTRRSVGTRSGPGESSVQRRPGGIRPGGGGRCAGPCDRVGRQPAWTRKPKRSWSGWSTNSDGHHMAMPCRERIRHCLEAAIARSEITPERIDYYNAHGTSTGLNDRVETQVLKDVFGENVRQSAGELDQGSTGP